MGSCVKQVSHEKSFVGAKAERAAWGAGEGSAVHELLTLSSSWSWFSTTTDVQV